MLALKLNCLWTCPPKWQLCFSLAPKIPSPSLCPGCLVQSKAPFGNCCAGFQWVNTLRFSDAWFSSLKTKMKANLVSVFVNAEAFQNVLIFWFDQKDLILVLVLVLDRASFKKRSKKKSGNIYQSHVPLQDRAAKVSSSRCLLPCHSGFSSCSDWGPTAQMVTSQRRSLGPGDLPSRHLILKKESTKITLGQGKAPESTPGQTENPQFSLSFPVFLFAYLQWFIWKNHREIHCQRQSKLTGCCHQQTREP